jgi:hypothetical protein
MLAVDEEARFQVGYASKLLSTPLKPGAHYNRNIGSESFGKLLNALRLEAELVRID